MSDVKATFSPKEYKYILIAIILVVGIILFKEMTIFLSGFMGATTLYVLLRNQHRALVEKRKWKKSISAFLLLLETIFIFLIPFSAVILLIADTISNINFDIELIQTRVYEFINFIENRFDIQLFSRENLSSILSVETLSKIPQFSGDIIHRITTSSYSILINSGIVLFVLYFMLYNYKEFETMIHELLPFKKKNKDIFKKETRLIIQANAIGIPLIALIQGILSYFGYWVFDVQSPLLFAILTAFATIIPVFGIGLVYTPIVIGLLVQGIYPNAIGLAVYGVVIVGASDNIIRLFLQMKMADIHPLVTFFGVFTGLSMFGFWGIIYGPLLLSLFILMIDMYRNDYVKDSVIKLNGSLDKDTKHQINLRGVKLIKKIIFRNNKKNKDFE